MFDVVRTINRRNYRIDTYYYDGAEQGENINLERPSEADVIERLSKDKEYLAIVAKSARLGDIVKNRLSRGK